MAQVKLAKADEIPDGGMIMKEHEGRQILLARIEGQVYAMDNICNHQGAELHEGDLGQEGPHLVTCPWHAAHFDGVYACDTKSCDAGGAADLAVSANDRCRRRSHRGKKQV